MFIADFLKKEESSVRSDMFFSYMPLLAELHFMEAFGSTDRPRLWRSKSTKLTHYKKSPALLLQGKRFACGLNKLAGKS
jgi:hypothetical protein